LKYSPQYPEPLLRPAISWLYFSESTVSQKVEVFGVNSIQVWPGLSGKDCQRCRRNGWGASDGRLLILVAAGGPVYFVHLAVAEEQRIAAVDVGQIDVDQVLARHGVVANSTMTFS
jgi:hypothetical protein